MLFLCVLRPCITQHTYTNSFGFLLHNMGSCSIVHVYLREIGQLFCVCTTKHTRGILFLFECCHNKDKNSTEMEPARVCSVCVFSVYTRKFSENRRTIMCGCTMHIEGGIMNGGDMKPTVVEFF